MVKASLKVRAAVVNTEPEVPASNLPRLAKVTVTRELRFHKYVMQISIHRMDVCSKRNVRAISGEPANFCPV